MHTNPPALGGTASGQPAHGATEPERAAFETWLRSAGLSNADASRRAADGASLYRDPCTQAAWAAWQAARAWVPTAAHKPTHGQWVVKRWRRTGTVWAGQHHDSAKNAAFDEWRAL